MLEKIFGQVLKNLRENTGVTQEILALNSELDRTYISLLERGLRTPTIATLFKMAPTLKKMPSEIIAIVEQKLNEDRV
ncbi:helix-turn-helix domain-containing protein [Mucilaginibacter flavus]|uniref:helix-turn-helix domain-containing protein n=1 Tax=Mucilaginibacter flavus TaxID=931504 RepID=UPI0025B47372|nr:helix-turn-helix transcriptional regulator [Mucilaginibacter flavus]MDN3580944.1 helix-turn-helix transcriptional regulator [Mucilaginibacter flavus]